MRRILAFVSAGVLAALATYVPAHAGGGVGGGGAPTGSGIGGGGVAPVFAGNAAVRVGAVTPPHHNYATLDYYPRIETVHQGDVVTFAWAADPNAIHTVTILPANAQASDATLSRLLPGAGAPMLDQADREMVLRVNQYQMKGCGNSPYFPGTGACSYTGGQVVNSGLLIPAFNPQTGNLIKGVPLPSFAVRFNAKPGVYHYFCLIHGPSMSGTIRVVPAAAPVTTAAQAAARSARQYRTQVAHAAASEASIHSGPTPGAAGHTNFIVQAGSQYGRVEMDQFYPAAADVKAGDTVTFTPGGFHTVTFLPPLGPAIQPQCEVPGPDKPFRGYAGCNMEVLLGKGALPYGNPAAYAGGPLNSGLLVVPQPHAFAVTFTKPGTYRYVCLVHAHMGGVITVH